MELTTYGTVREAVEEKTVAVAFDGGTVEEALAAFVAAHPEAEAVLYDGVELRSSVRVTVDGEHAALDDDCPADAEVTIFPAIHGG